MSFILSFLDRGWICSRMFQGGKRLGGGTGCRDLFHVIFSLIPISTINGESSIPACRTELGGEIFFRFFVSGSDWGTWLLLPSFLCDSFQWSFFPYLLNHSWRSHFDLLDIHPTYLIFIFPCLVLSRMVEQELPHPLQGVAALCLSPEIQQKG